jgi:uncharacterized peroxidase-related enzyme
VEAVLAGFRTAPISDRLRAMLGYLEKVTLRPEAVGVEDLAPLRECGISDEAIADAVHVCAAFQIYDRLADAMGWHVPDEPSSFWSKQARYLLKAGYEGGRKPRPA